MEQLQFREKEIFETLKKIKKRKFVVIGGYAVNVYTLPRFSVDCDIVIKDRNELGKIEEDLFSLGYEKIKNYSDEVPYEGNFERYEKELGQNFKLVRRLELQLKSPCIKSGQPFKLVNLL